MDVPAGDAAAAGDDVRTRSGDMGSIKDDRGSRSGDTAGIGSGMFTGIFVMSTINLTLVGPKKLQGSTKKFLKSLVNSCRNQYLCALIPRRLFKCYP